MTNLTRPQKETHRFRAGITGWKWQNPKKILFLLAFETKVDLSIISENNGWLAQDIYFIVTGSERAIRSFVWATSLDWKKELIYPRWMPTKDQVEGLEEVSDDTTKN